MKFSGKTVAITGAAGGIGQALCRYFAGEGAAIAALDKSEEIQAFVSELIEAGCKAAPYVVDVGDRTAVERSFAAIVSELGPVDILVNNAGFSQHPIFARTNPASWQHEVNGNLNSAYYC